ncbi:type II toxin-antitoxin system prevent-host-death family antitoxin [Azoarcus sp. DN11]|uniref:type II toxin-antitoxin system Phd/YefM family antitoxin n=1 Tax=Azoarcus sp. DN11 TaxID=356837 RepID=UPI00257042C6|nr:type II toxin-antitoxin system prevent-host-death family antitoxin [Azoarcus sp. DN11]
MSSYEARTKLAELLRGVLAGNIYTITVRGEPVADLVPAAANKNAFQSEAVERMKEFMRTAPAAAGVDLKELIDDGRA